jgi:hypothetical protein
MTTHTTSPTSDTDSALIADVEAHLEAITPGPWFWRGNVDFSDPSLVGSNGFDVLSSVPVERTADDHRLDSLDDVAEDDEHRAELLAEFLFDENGDPRSDSQLSFTVDGWKKPARTMAIFEVCRDATSRDDTRVYRADVVGVRHPDAEFIAQAPVYVANLLAALKAANARVAELEADLNR